MSSLDSKTTKRKAHKVMMKALENWYAKVAKRGQYNMRDYEKELEAAITEWKASYAKQI